MRKTSFATMTIVALIGAAILAPAARSATGVDSSSLRDAVTVEGIREHQAALQAIADANDGTRASGTPGYDLSADYVAGRLAAAGYEVTRQVFEFQFFEEAAPPEMEQISPNPTVYQAGSDFATMEYSGSGDVTAPVQATDDVIVPPAADPNTSSSGCEPEDFNSFTPGNIALVQRGSCTFQQKALNAIDAGATAVIIFNEGQDGRTAAVAGTLGSSEGITVPVVGASYALGEELYELSQQPDGVTVRIATTTTAEPRTTENVIAETPTGRDDRVVVVGAHLDSVLEGPGINDNGSGTGAILEVAEEMAELGIEPRNAVRFAFWGAEESGLVGSEHYVEHLSKSERKDIALNLNFDMVGSPNFVRFVYDGDGSDTPVAGPTGSAQIESMFVDYFESQGLASEPTEFSGRSDYGPFIAVGIPAGGLFTGAEGIKTAEQAAVYGGIAGEAYDPCYHAACDTFDGTGDGSGATPPGLGLVALDQMSDAIAHGVLTFAMTTAAVPGTDRASSSDATGTMEFRGSHRHR